VIGGLLVVCCAGGASLLAYATAQAAKPLEAAQAFCGDLKGQAYSAAYTLLSSRYQATLSQTQFVQTAQLQDQVDGTVQSCGLQTGSTSNFSIDFSQNPATIAAQIARKKTFSGNLMLVKQGSDCKIDTVDPSLQGTDLGPLEKGNAFCQFLATGNFAGAWQQFSTSLQAQRPKAQYIANIKSGLAQLSKQLGVTVKIAGCKLGLSTYTVSSDDSTASATSDLMVRAGSPSVDQPQKMDFIKEAAGWRIESLTNIKSLTNIT
jgi:hypothetical protein